MLHLKFACSKVTKTTFRSRLKISVWGRCHFFLAVFRNGFLLSEEQFNRKEIDWQQKGKQSKKKVLLKVCAYHAYFVCDKKHGQGRPSLIFTLKFQDLALIEVTRAILADFSSSNLGNGK